MLPTLKIKCHYPDMPRPMRAHSTHSGIDLTLMRVEEKNEQILFFDLGVSIEPPPGYYAELYPRSSAYKHNFIMANSVGIIDADYRGIIMMPMRYVGTGKASEEAEKLLGKRVGQLIVKKLESLEIRIVETLNNTNRGEKGFGSSGE